MTRLLTISASSMTLFGSVGSMFLSMDGKAGCGNEPSVVDKSFNRKACTKVQHVETQTKVRAAQLSEVSASERLGKLPRPSPSPRDCPAQPPSRPPRARRRLPPASLSASSRPPPPPSGLPPVSPLAASATFPCPASLRSPSPRLDAASLRPPSRLPPRSLHHVPLPRLPPVSFPAPAADLSPPHAAALATGSDSRRRIPMRPPSLPLSSSDARRRMPLRTQLLMRARRQLLLQAPSCPAPAVLTAPFQIQ
nr:vegetative cell wall protein gp1-like [Lolium perenne]